MKNSDNFIKEIELDIALSKAVGKPTREQLEQEIKDWQGEFRLSREKAQKLLEKLGV